MRVTLFGASGLLGQELVRELSADPINDLLTALSSKTPTCATPPAFANEFAIPVLTG